MFRALIVSLGYLCSRSPDRLATSGINYLSRAGLQYEKKTMHNEKARRIRNAHRAFVEKTMEGATRIFKKG